MSRLSTIRRRLLLGAGFVVVLSGLSLMVVHTGLVRRFVLVQLQTRLGNTTGLVINAKELDYNLLTSRFELSEIALRGAKLGDMPTPLRAQFISLRVPLWRLLRGSFDTAQIRIDGLSVNLLTAADGRSNLPAIESKGSGKPGGPSIRITSGFVALRDERNGYRLQLPIGNLSAAWNPATSAYGIYCESTGGQFEANGSRLPLDRLQLKAAASSAGVTVDSLRLTSGTSQAEISGALSGSPERVSASANLNLDMGQLNQAWRFSTKPAQGRLMLHLSATGLLQAASLQANLQGDDLIVEGIPIRNLVADALLDTATGEVQLRNLSAALFSGQLNALGRLSLTDRGRSAITATLARLNVKQAAAAFGSSGAPARRASITLKASAPGLDWRRATATGSVDMQPATLSFRANVAGDSLHATLESRVGDSAGMQGDLAFRFANRSLTGALNGRVDSLARFGGTLEQLLERPAGSLTGSGVDGAAQWSATLGGAGRVPAASLQLHVDGLSVGGWTGAALNVSADYASGRIALESARVDWGGQRLDVKGEIGGLSADAPLNLQGTLQGRSLAGVFESLGAAQTAEAAISGDLRVSGSLGRPAADASLRTAELMAFGQRFTNASLDARWQDDTLTLSRLSAQQLADPGAPARLEASGSLNVATNQYAIDATIGDFRPNGVALSDGLPLTGTFQLKAHGAGSISDPGVTAEITGAGLKIGSTSLGKLDVKVDAGGHRAKATLALPSLNLNASSTVRMEGAWPFELTVDAKKTHIETTADATFDADIQASGTLREPHVERVAAAIGNLKLETGGEKIVSDGPLDLVYADGRIQVRQFGLKSGASTLRVSGEMPFQDQGAPGSLSLQGSLDLAPLAKLLPPADESRIAGVVDVNASLTGSVQSWQPGGSLTVRQGSFQSKVSPYPIENIAAGLTFENGALHLRELTGTAGTATLRLDGSLPFGLISNELPGSKASAGQLARLSAVIEKLAFAGGSGTHSSSITFDTKIEAEASSLSLSALRATADVTNLEVTAENMDLRQASPTRIQLGDDVARLESLDLKGGGASFKASGSVGLTGSFPLQLSAVGETDLAVFAALAPSLDAAGKVRMDVELGGTLNDPHATGFVDLEQGTLLVTNPPIAGRNVNLRAELAGKTLSIKRFNGNLNGGAFEGGGEMKLSSAGLTDVNLFLKGKDVFAEYPASVKTTSVVDVALVSRGDHLVLEGQIEVQEGYHEATLDLLSKSSLPLDVVSEDTPQTPGKPVGLDLKIVTKRPIEMDNNLGRLSLMADLRLAGTFTQPRVLGALQLEEDGRLYFGDRTYYIDRGTVRFLDAPIVTPELNIKAYTRTGDYTIWLGLKGELSEITTEFTSDPPLSRDDVIAVLLTGKTVAENRGVDLRALEATSLATGALNASLSSQLHRTIGVSRVSIQPAAVAAESNPGARVTIIQDFTRSFRLLYSMNLQDSNDQIWVGEYDLSRRFTTRAVKQSDNTYRGEFRHDVRFGSAGPAAATASFHTPTQKISQLRFIGADQFAPEQLAKTFKVKAGQKYKSIKVRQGSTRLATFFGKQGYLESRVRLDRQESPEGLDLTVRVELGPVVELAFRGADISKREAGRLRKTWRSGISDQQRPLATKEAILGALAVKGYLAADADFEISGDEGHKSVRFDIKPGIKYRDVKVVIAGAEPTRAHEVLSLVKGGQLKQAVYRSQPRVGEVITAYYRQRGYLSAKVSPPVQRLDADRRTGQIVIAVQEGRPFQVGAVQFSGNQALSAAALQDGLQLEAGKTFEPARLEPSIAALKLKYGKLGYREADVEYSIKRDNEHATIDVSFAITENRQTSIGTVSVEGNRRTSEKFARNQLKIGEGEVANTQLVRESVKNLSQTGAYTSADIQLRPVVAVGQLEPPVDVADLVVGVTEPKPFRLLYGGLYDSGNGPGFIADLQNHNSLGAGRVLGLRTRVDPETDELRLYLTQPTLRSRRISTTLGVYYTRETEDYQTVPTEKLGVSIQQDTQLRSKFLLSYGYRYEKQRGFVPDPAAPDIPQSIVAISPLTVTITREARDSFLDATHGSFMSHGFELAPKILGSDYPYLRYYGQYFKYFPLKKPRPVPFGEKARPSNLVFATGSRIGMQKGFNSTGAVLTDRFYAGGGTTVRGFKQDELGPRLANGQPAGGNAVLVLNEELRYHIVWIFDAVNFLDVGNVFPRVSDFRVSDLRAATGFGLRIRNPFVVLRFDYGFKFHRRPGETMGAFFFSIGQAF